MFKKHEKAQQVTFLCPFGNEVLRQDECPFNVLGHAYK